MNFGVGFSGGEADDVLEAQIHIWKHMFNFINSIVLNCVVELSIPDTIHEHGEPMSLSALASTLQINPTKVQALGRLMRISTQSGFFYVKKLITLNDNEEEGYELTKAGLLLLKNNPLSVTPYLFLILNQEGGKPWHLLSSWFQNGDQTAFQTAQGKTLWEFTNHKQEYNQHFQEAMACESKFVAAYLFNNSEGLNLGKYLFEGLNSLVDVGGGNGTMTKAIADAYPQLSCICFDLPRVIDGIQETANMTFVSGDMFKEIPQADAILLKSVLHDWNDEECAKILIQCKKAIMKNGGGGKIIIIEVVVDNQNENYEIQLLLDLAMMMTTTGKERNEEQWRKLFLDAGFSHYEITSTPGLMSVIQVYL